MAKKLEVNYDRQIYSQLEESLEKVDKLTGEIKKLKTSHAQEIHELKEAQKKAKKELKIRKEQPEEVAAVLQEIVEMNRKYAIKISEEKRRYKEINPNNEGLKGIYGRKFENLKRKHREELSMMKSKHLEELLKLREKIRNQEQEIMSNDREIAKQKRELEQLKEQNRALRNIIGKNSGNSSKATVFERVKFL
jgi:NDP-sugar pyrophosphorylase family protein